MSTTYTISQKHSPSPFQAPHAPAAAPEVAPELPAAAAIVISPMITLTAQPIVADASAPEWPGARWIGAIDVEVATLVDRLTLVSSEGFERARLLVRDGASVCGVIDVPIVEGAVSGDELARRILSLPTTNSSVDTSALPSMTVVLHLRANAPALRTPLRAILHGAESSTALDVVVVVDPTLVAASRRVIKKDFAGHRISVVESALTDAAHAFNRGVEAATGDLVAFTSTDALIDEHWAAELAAGFVSASSVDVVVGQVASAELGTIAHGAYDEGRSAGIDLSSFASPQTFAIRRELALELNGFDAAFGAADSHLGVEFLSRVVSGGATVVSQPSALLWHRPAASMAEMTAANIAGARAHGAWLMKGIRARRVSLAQTLTALSTTAPGARTAVIAGAIGFLRQKSTADAAARTLDGVPHTSV